MPDLRFEWDERKSASNRRKHGVSFEEAETVFYDDRAIFRDDPDEEEENLFILLRLERRAAHSRRLSLLPRGRFRHSNHFSSQGAPRGAPRLRHEVANMRDRYDFSKGKRNPYAKRLKKQVTIRLDEDTLEYFKGLADDTEIPYQTLINLYLRECAKTKKRPGLKWRAAG
jgi:uncharacterized protein (DUF4415 family)